MKSMVSTCDEQLFASEDSDGETESDGESE